MRASYKNKLVFLSLNFALFCYTANQLFLAILPKVIVRRTLFNQNPIVDDCRAQQQQVTFLALTTNGSFDYSDDE
jgi:hypothetical protein